MVFRYEGWTLYVIEPEFRVIGKRKMYFFSKRIPEKGEQCDMPEGYKVGVNKKTNLPYLMYSNRVSLHQRRKKAKLEQSS